jgi:hypothetical protein
MLAWLTPLTGPILTFVVCDAATTFGSKIAPDATVMAVAPRVSLVVLAVKFWRMSRPELMVVAPE